MRKNSYNEIYLHLTWHTKDNIPALQGAFEDRAHRYLAHRVVETPGAFVYEVGGTDDHVHLVVRIPPAINIADWIGELKGASAHHLNHNVRVRAHFGWQTGYGVVSFGEKDLPYVRDYVKNQRERHRTGKIHARLERTECEEPVAEAAVGKPVETGC